jgi:hypothetical protein
MKELVKQTLERKLLESETITKWFENEYSPSFADEDELNEMLREADKVNAQIKILRFLLTK